MIQYLLTGVGAGLVAILGNVIMFRLNRRATKEDMEFQKIKASVEANDRLTEELKIGVRALLHDRLYQGCRYFLKLGTINEAELSNMGRLYESYHQLGGNGTGTELFKRIQSLPLTVEYKD